MATNEGEPKLIFNVFIRDIIVHDDRDPGPARGEYEVVFGAVGVPHSAGDPATVRWAGSVSSRRTYDVAQWTGVAALPSSGGKLSIAGAGLEHDPGNQDAILGGVATFEQDREWGVGQWWRTVNGRHFDFIFCVTPAEEAGEAARPIWTGETYDAPGPDKLTAATYRSILGG